MTVEQGSAAAETTKAQTAPEGTDQTGAEAETKLYTEAEVAAMVAAAAKKAVEEAMASVQRPAVGSGDTVTVVYMAEVSPDNVLILPEYGTMRPNSALEIPKKEFGGKFMSQLARKLIDKRHLIVVDGLTDDERRRWNCLYRDGEFLDERAFDRMLDFDVDELTSMFKLLCPEHKRFVARRFISASERGDNRINIDKIKAINDISKAIDPDGMLRPVMEKFKSEID